MSQNPTEPDKATPKATATPKPAPSPFIVDGKEVTEEVYYSTAIKEGVGDFRLIPGGQVSPITTKNFKPEGK